MIIVNTNGDHLRHCENSSGTGVYFPKSTSTTTSPFLSTATLSPELQSIFVCTLVLNFSS
jgi:hypothetical protein